jgi:excinuclease UvrABC ATPase subunit
MGNKLTFPGGEAQRINLLENYLKRYRKPFYIWMNLTGLHFEDIRVLMEVINWLIKNTY